MYKAARNLTVLGIGLSISAIVGWLLLKEKKREKEITSMTVKSQSHPTEPEEIPQIVLPLEDLASQEESDLDVGDAEADDLTQINDIGPRFAEALRAIGITRFTQLAEQTPKELAEQLAQHVNVRPQRIRNNDWIGQAAQLAKS
jgi:predicted flap endonuclease-1-like 5' DNA nuclease